MIEPGNGHRFSGEKGYDPADRRELTPIEILQAIQAEHHYLPKEVLERVCRESGLTPARLIGVATFYNQFRFHPAGKHRIRVCHGTACHVKRAPLLQDALRRYLNLSEGEDTDADGSFSIEQVACLGCCTLAPVVQIDESVYGAVTPEKVPLMLRDFTEPTRSAQDLHDRIRSNRFEKPEGEIRIGVGSCCSAKGSDRLREALEKELARFGIPVAVKKVGCVGMCHRTPLVEVVRPGKPSVHYASVGPEDARGIVSRHFRPPGVFKKARFFIEETVSRWLEGDRQPSITRFSLDMRDRPVRAFLDKQVHIATEHFGVLNPLDLDEYRHLGGFEALRCCLEEKNPEDVIRKIKESGLRGRGGAGFPTGEKWERVRKAQGEPKYVICNGDEGDPGAFMDRMILESFPYRVIEGMILTAFAVGAEEGLFYIRSEYPLALRIVREGIRNCEESGLLGEDILETGMTFRLRVVEGAGAFVSGEETALLASVEGRRSVPRLRPPFPAERGLWERPTCINNVETYALVPWILRNGAAAFARMGTGSSKGTKVFALAGKVARGGLVEVPMGMTLREIVEDIGGGVEGGGRLKAVQVGGPSGGCVPARLADTPVDYEALKEIGAIMGSGGLVVLDENDCMVDMARYFLEFTQNESCGKCTFCRVGTKRMLEIMNRLCEGTARPDDLQRLEDLAFRVRQSSFCGLGKTAPNPVLTTLRYFRDEYEAHVEGRCPAGKCKSLIRYTVTDDCIGCTLCYQHCPVDAIGGSAYKIHEIDSEKCIRCDMCRLVCPEESVIVETPAA